MALERISTNASFLDVLDRVLDKGIVIDAWVRMSLIGINLITLEARIIVASIETYLKHVDVLELPSLLLARRTQQYRGQAPRNARLDAPGVGV